MKTARCISPSTRLHRPRGEDDVLRELERIHAREIWLKPGDPIGAVANSATAPISIRLRSGTYYLLRPIVVTVPGVRIYGAGAAILRRSVASLLPMITVAANRVRLDGLILDDDAGSGDALRVAASYVELCDLYVPAGPVGVAVGAGVFLVNADNCFLDNVHVEPSVPARPLGAPGITTEIWLDDASQRGRLCACDADGGGMISYLGLSGSTNDGACVPAVTVR